MLLTLGKRGEEEAARFLLTKGYRVLARNFHSKFGELDIIAIEGDVLVFVEVKTRSNRLFGSPEESINYKKIQKIKKSAAVFISRRHGLPEKMRIDLVAIDILPDSRGSEMRIVKNIA